MLRFYRALGFSAPDPDEWTTTPSVSAAIQFGNNKINLHAPELWESPAMTLRGPNAVPGCGDFCFTWDGSLDELRAMLDRANTPIEEGPVERIGGAEGGTARGTSIYTRDPDRNLLEFIVYERG
jgi:hypothetical protein